MPITVRAAEPIDIPGIQRLYACPNAQANTLQLPCISLRLWEKRLSMLPENFYCFVAEQNGEIVGQLGFELCTNQRRRHVGEFGMAVHDAQLRKGIGSQLITAMLNLADNWINLRRIELTVFCDNKSAIALYQKFGFIIEGQSPEYAFRDGEFIDAYHMGRLNPTVNTPAERE